MRKICLSKEFCNYVEMLNYEVDRYNDLLNTINRKDNPMTDEEWNSSWEYFSNLKDEAEIKYMYIKQLITEIYLNDEEKDNYHSWLLDYKRQELFIYCLNENFKWEPDLSEEEQFGNALSRFYYNYFEDHDKESHLARTTTFQVTEDCNMACTYCYQHNKKPRSMTFDIAKRYIDMFLDNSPKINTYYDSSTMVGAIFDFIGGEPWLEIDLIDQISNYIITELFRRKHRLAIKFMFSICSNGLLQPSEKVQCYLRKHKNHLSYNVTVDGNKKLHDACRLDKNGHGTYDRAIASALDYRDNIGGKMSSKMTISPFNVSYLYESVIDIINKGYKHINLNCVMEKGWEVSHATEHYWQLHKIIDYLNENNLLDEIGLSIFSEEKGRPAILNIESEANPCGGAGGMLAIDWKGDIYPCLRYMENSVPPEVREPYIIGNVYDGINIKTEHKKRVNHLRNITRRYSQDDKCYYCPIGSRCPGCNGYYYEYNGDPGKRTTFVCDIAKAESLANFYYWKLKGKKDIKLYCPRDWAIDIIGEEEYNKLLSMEEEMK